MQSKEVRKHGKEKDNRKSLGGREDYIPNNSGDVRIVGYEFFKKELLNKDPDFLELLDKSRPWVVDRESLI